MTEAEWLACDDSSLMLDYLRTSSKASERKCRLLICALARSMWENLPDERSRKAVEVAESFADGSLDRDALRRATFPARAAHGELRDAFIAARRAAGGKYRKHVKAAAARADASAVALATVDPPCFKGAIMSYGGDPLDFYDDTAAVGSVLTARLDLIHELFGNPFSPVCPDLVKIVCEWSAVVQLALAIHDSGWFEDMPVLADALLDAGCTDEAILTHLRSPGPHVRGCWALDLVLGKP